MLLHSGITIKSLVHSSFWVDKTGSLIQVVVPSLGLIATRTGYDIKDFPKEEPRIFKQLVEGNDHTSAFEQKAVTLRSGDTDIAATLTLPTGKGPFPTILMVQDLEPLNRDGNDPSKPYSLAGTWKQLAFYLASQGISTLRFDTPGVGESGGSKEDIDYDARVKALENMASWLVRLPSTKGDKVIGGVIAAGAASKAPVKGIVAIGYPAKDLLRLWKEQVSTIEDPQKRQKAYEDLDTLHEELNSGKGSEVEFKGRKLNMAGIRRLASLDPAQMAGELKIPCLFVYPTEDRVVLGYHKDLIKEHLHSGQEVIALKGLSHQLTQAVSTNKIGGIVETKALSPIAEWIKARYNTGKSN